MYYRGCCKLVFHLCGIDLLALALDIVDEVEGGIEESADAVGEAGRLGGGETARGDVGNASGYAE